MKEKRTATAWDREADSYQRTFRLGLNEYNAELLRFWEEKGMLFPGCRVIDIGCGVGKYGTYFAELGYDVTLTDISPRMLERAAENMARFDTPWRIFPCDFTEISGKEEVFAEGFDLAISTMSPAICDVQTVKKMSDMTRGWCFLARFAAWSQPGRDKLLRALGLEPKPPFDNLSGDCAAIIQSVCEAGYMPQVKYTDYNWNDRRTPEEAADYMRRYLGEEEAAIDRETVRAATEKLCGENGLFEDAVNTKVAWIYWKTRKDTDE